MEDIFLFPIIHAQAPPYYIIKKMPACSPCLSGEATRMPPAPARDPRETIGMICRDFTVKSA